jgi:hypothetical protein
VTSLAPLDKFRVPIGNQEIELQEVGYAAGGMPFLRVRIRERTRFTIFEVDPVTAARWARGMLAWAEANAGDTPPEPPAA